MKHTLSSSSTMLVLLLLLCQFFECVHSFTCTTFPPSQLNVLQDLYDSTNGDNWRWRSVSTAGAIWNFSSPNPNPCTEDWQGINCTTTCMIQGIGLTSYNLKGTLPSSLGLLNEMKNFSIGYNAVKGSIPSTLSNWTSLLYIDLQRNRLTGTFPTFITSSWFSLRSLVMSYNQLSGSLPTDINALSSLSVINLRSNQLQGTIPTTLTEITTLTAFYMRYNRLTGTIPDNIGNLQQLEVFDISGNQLVGSIPDFCTSLTRLEVFYGYLNDLSGSIPKDLDKMISMHQFSVNSNHLTGTVPWFGSLNHTVLFRIDDNQFTGSLPNCLQNLTALEIFNATINQLTGTLPSSFQYSRKLRSLDVSSNRLTGTVNHLFTNAPLLQQLILDTNRFHGNVHGIVDANVNTVLSSIDISDNHFTSSLPQAVFNLKNITLFAAAKNCFTGILPDSICNMNATIETLVLDGLHTQTSCQQSIFPGVNTYLITSPVHGLIPSCLFSDNMQSLTLLHISGNGLEGSLPDSSSSFTLSPTLTTLSLAHNRLVGTIPKAFQQASQWSMLDLSFNKFTGYINDQIYSYERVNSSLKLENNRLSGEIPSSLKSAVSIDILQGNMFECDAAHTQLPPNDPHEKSYECASTATDDAIYTWIAFLLLLIVLYFSESFVRRFVVSGTAYLAAFASIRKEIGKWWIVYSNFTPKNRNMFEFGLTMREIRRWSVRMMIIVVMVFIPTYGTLTSLYGTYTKQYAWTISIAFLTGLRPTIVLLALLVALLFALYSPTNRFLLLNFFRVGKRVKKKMKLTLQFYFSQFDDNNAGDKGEKHGGGVMDAIERGTLKKEQHQQHKGEGTAEEEGDDRDTVVSLSDLDRASAVIEPVKFSLQDARTFYRWYAMIGALSVINVALVIVVNMLYVYAISNNNLQSYEKETLSFSVSVFKLIWNGIVMDMMYYYIHNELLKIPSISHSEMMSKRSLLLPLMLWLSIFNNIIVPFIAVAFISPSCFYYAIYPSVPVETEIVFAGCTENIRQSPSGGYYTTLTCNSDSLPYSISYNPPFAYSFQCTSILLSSFTDIFMYRYILGGAVVPVSMMVLKFIQEYILMKYGWESQWFHLISIAIPTELRPLQHPPEEMKGKPEEGEGENEREREEKQGGEGEREGEGERQTDMIPSPSVSSPSMMMSSFFTRQTSVSKSNANANADTNDTSRDSMMSTVSSTMGQLSRQVSTKAMTSATSAVNEGLNVAKDLTNKIQNLKLQDINKMLGLSADSDMSFGLYSSIIMFATDIAILLTFGTMFPPLAVIGCCTVYIRTFYMQFTLGRIISLSNKQPYLKKLVIALNEECLGISKLLMTCLLSLPLLLSLLWSWFLFDIWGDRTGFNPAFYIFFCLPSIPLLFLPIVFPAIQKYVIDIFCPAKNNWDNTEVRGKTPRIVSYSTSSSATASPAAIQLQTMAVTTNATVTTTVNPLLSSKR